MTWLWKFHFYTLLRYTGPFSLLIDRKWRSLSPHSGHLFYFSPSDIGKMVKRVGLELIEMVPEQASLGRGSLWRVLNDLHFALARLLFRLSNVSIAGKELYIARKSRVAS